MKNVSKPIKIGDESWFGSCVILNPGVSIVSRIIIASGGVVSKNITEEFSLYAGVPVKKIKNLNN